MLEWNVRPRTQPVPTHQGICCLTKITVSNAAIAQLVARKADGGSLNWTDGIIAGCGKTHVPSSLLLSMFVRCTLLKGSKQVASRAVVCEKDLPGVRKEPKVSAQF
jgi:hypothetical protein